MSTAPRSTSLIIAGIVLILLILIGLAYFFTTPRPIEVTPTRTIPETTTTPTPPIGVTTTPTPLVEVKVPDKILIGFTLPLSGTFSKEGQLALKGALVAVKWVNEVYGGVRIGGKRVPIEIKYYDDESKRDLVVSLYERLVTVDKVHFLVGTYTSTLVMAAAPVAEKYKMVFVNWGGASDMINRQGFRYVVTTWTQASRYMAPVLDVLVKYDPEVKRIALVWKEDEFNRLVAEGVRVKARELGLTIVYDRSFPIGTLDFTPILVELRAIKPDVIITGNHFADGLAITKQMADLKVNAKLIAVNVAPSVPDYYKSLGLLAEGIVFPSEWEPGVWWSPEHARKFGLEFYGPLPQEFHIIFLGMHKEEPTEYSASLANAIILLVKAIELAQSLDQDAVREAFNKMDIMTFFGRFKIDPATGFQLGHISVIGQWQDGKKVIVWPSEVATGRLYYPVPTWEEKTAGKKAIP
ncbi:MAG: amino acid ABC transporter substrate-binding protein [Acidilobaceae archaeon]